MINIGRLAGGLGEKWSEKACGLITLYTRPIFHFISRYWFTSHFGVVCLLLTAVLECFVCNLGRYNCPWSPQIAALVFTTEKNSLSSSSISSSVLCAQSLPLCPTVCDPHGLELPGSSLLGILQARILEWVAMSSSRGSYWPKDVNPHLLCLISSIYFILV